MRHWWSILFVGAVFSETNVTDIAHVISDYAKVSVNENTDNPSAGQVLTSTESSPRNKTNIDDNDDEMTEYEDFDDLSASTNRPLQSPMDGQSMLKYVSGLVNLFALMYKYGDNRKYATRGKSQARYDQLADNINSLSVAEDRYNPTTATKKFKLAQGGYPPLKLSPVYTPAASPSLAESYSSNGGKTSYDADSDQYMIKHPDSFSADDAIYKPKPSMNDYMTQNEPPLDIKQSYSYQLPQQMPAKNRPGVESKEPVDIQQSISYELPAEKPKQMKHASHPATTWKNAMAQEDQGEDSPWDQHIDDNDQHEEEKPLGPVYYPRKKKKPTRPPAEPTIEEQPEDHDHPPDYAMDTMPKSPKHPVELAPYYPWMNPSKKPKPPPPPPEDDDEPPEEIPPWANKAPVKLRPPKDGGLPPPDHLYPYTLYGHDHGLLYPGEDDHHGGHEGDHTQDDHGVKEEDRESKRPYTYYHLGRKLWYVPLLFSLYFIVYIGALLLKSIARHKVQFPEKLWDLHDHHNHHGDHHDRQGRTLDQVTEQVLTQIDSAHNKFM